MSKFRTKCDLKEAEAEDVSCLYAERVNGVQVHVVRSWWFHLVVCYWSHPPCTHGRRQKRRENFPFHGSFRAFPSPPPVSTAPLKAENIVTRAAFHCDVDAASRCTYRTRFTTENGYAASDTLANPRLIVPRSAKLRAFADGWLKFSNFLPATAHQLFRAVAPATARFPMLFRETNKWNLTGWFVPYWVARFAINYIS